MDLSGGRVEAIRSETVGAALEYQAERAQFRCGVVCVFEERLV
ncbi:hypothetical protein VIC_001353 [Vibrio coralliilyticus ATCC BAA-450]|nr:hypothetical protein VIC_001353 [Vibrio coralliilyticus ATCC BAA-450]